MRQDCWTLSPERGFLISPDPFHTSVGAYPWEAGRKDMVAEIDGLAAAMTELLESHRVRIVLDALNPIDYSDLEHDVDAFPVVEKLMQVYSYFASAFVYATHEEPAHRLPAGVAVPLYTLARLVERPPILSYSGYVLNNWRRVDPAGDIVLGNITTQQHFLGGRDEDWFILVHVEIENRASGALNGIQAAVEAAAQGDTEALLAALERISTSVGEMVRTFARMPEGCDSDVYYFRVRPYIFGFNDVVYEGVMEYGGQPQNFRGQTGAQSSIIPALVAGLGLEHEQSGLTQHLEVMKAYMPRPHRAFITQMGHSTVRAVVKQNASHMVLREAYNLCLERVSAFRKLHYHFVVTYIHQKVENPLGTGGTVFMDWLGKLLTETNMQYISAPNS